MIQQKSLEIYESVCLREEEQPWTLRAGSEQHGARGTSNTPTVAHCSGPLCGWGNGHRDTSLSSLSPGCQHPRPPGRWCWSCSELGGHTGGGGDGWLLCLPRTALLKRQRMFVGPGSIAPCCGKSWERQKPVLTAAVAAVFGNAFYFLAWK